MRNQLPTLTKSKVFSFFYGNKFLIAVLSVFVALILLGVFQDYLESKRNNTSFYFSESLLFKSFWLIFPPILWLLKYLHQSKKIDTYSRMGVTLIVATLAHVVMTSLTVWCLSVIFRDQSYGVIKVLTFTLANDLLKITLVYGVYIYALKYLASHNHKMKFDAQSLDDQPTETLAVHAKSIEKQSPDDISSTNYLVVNSGKNNTRINLSDILFIQSATPYVSIQMEAQEYLHSTTLKSMAEKLDYRFIRIHRSIIVNTEKVLSYQSRLNGDYDLTLDNGSKVRLSRNYAKAFISRFKATPQLKTETHRFK
ncbi:LytTr DNA-binding domain-containing protein [Marinicella litoralis]|uniref:LytTr DNA-binding domain-containing protein n=2 Tax=Marinicella litoralis TaxID=644220 RepID=A0A4R6XHR2_9GAMM|nr:LytTr DNA-binding domain-containing protein [Marinicella litoralis]